MSISGTSEIRDVEAGAHMTLDQSGQPFALCPKTKRSDSSIRSQASHGSEASRIAGASMLREARELFEQAIPYHNTSRTCCSNWTLAISVGFWVSVLGFFTYEQSAGNFVFGHRGPLNLFNSTSNGTVESVILECGEFQVGRMRVVRPKHVATTQETSPIRMLVPWTADMGSWSVENPDDIWCGMLPEAVLSYWPNVAQLIVFSVFRSTGTTIQLSWQGVIGTASATANLWLMMWLYPSGARTIECTAELAKRRNCAAGEAVSEDGEYNVVVAWVDVMFVLFLFLLSKANMNTLMFGLSWHVTYMMDFMNPSIGANSYLNSLAILATTILGALVAILATMVPQPLLNSNLLADDCSTVTASIVKTWEDAVNYYSGSHRSARRFQLARCVEAMAQVKARADGHFDGTWWETFDQGRRGKTRVLLKHYAMHVTDIMDVLYAMGHSVATEDFGGEHVAFCDVMRDPMQELLAATKDLMVLVQEACTDGVLEEKEIRLIDTQAKVVKKTQEHLVEAFRRTSPDVSVDLAEENIFVFSLSFWARKMTDFADELCSQADTSLNPSLQTTLLRDAQRGLCATWSWQGITELEHLKFAIRNFISIAVCYILGYSCDSGIFSPGYSSIMANTLSLLILSDGPHQAGSAMQKNLNRLVGVSLGKFFPILLGEMFASQGCFSDSRVVMQFFGVWGYVSVFCYIYYTSAMWGYLGCLIAGLGVYELFKPCSDSGTEAFIARYEEIGQVTIAIILQLVVQVFLSKRAPREIAVTNLREMGAVIRDCYEAFFASDLSRMQSTANQLDAKLAVAKKIAPECDSRLALAPCGSTPFKIELYKGALDELQLLYSEYKMLIMAVKDWTQDKSVYDSEVISSNLRSLNSQPAMDSVKAELMDSMTATMQSLPLILAHRTEDSLREQVRDPDTVRGAFSLDGVCSLYDQLNEHLRNLQLTCPHVIALTSDTRTRVNVAVRALENSAVHLAKVEELCLKELIQ